MGQVILNIGGQSYTQSCRDGDEAHLNALGEMLDAKVMQAIGSVGTASEVRGLLLGSLLLADELADARKGVVPAPAPPPVAVPPDPAPLEAIAERLERLAVSLENAAT
jgi:cell division protein ZapA